MTITKVGNNQTIMTKGTKHVSIWFDCGRVTATLFVGNECFFQSSATLTRWTGKTYCGAQKWAAKLLK